MTQLQMVEQMRPKLFVPPMSGHGVVQETLPSRGGVQAGRSGNLTEFSASSAIAVATTQRWLGISQVPQVKSYYCGPASGYTIIKYLNGNANSVKDGSSLTQTNIANANHMKTDANGVTSWASKNFVLGINAWRGANYYVQIGQPSAATFKGAVLYSINGSYPFGADTVEFAGGAHYNGHKTSITIGHWLAGYGYYNSGDTTSFSDPVGNSTAVSWSAGVQPYFDHATASFATTYLQSNGIAY
jgi:hypothetical protein